MQIFYLLEFRIIFIKPKCYISINSAGYYRKIGEESQTNKATFEFDNPNHLFFITLFQFNLFSIVKWNICSNFVDNHQTKINTYYPNLDILEYGRKIANNKATFNETITVSQLILILKISKYLFYLTSQMPFIIIL